MAGRERLSQPRGGDILLSDSASSSSDEESLRMAKQVVPYSKEPEWTEAELLAHVAESESSATEEEVDGDGILGDWPPASRVGNKEWCFAGSAKLWPCAMSASAATNTRSRRRSSVTVELSAYPFCPSLLPSAWIEMSWKQR